MTLSPSQAQKLVLLSQAIHQNSAYNNSKQAVLNVIEQLGYIQIDTISVVQRAHHHTLWSRNKHYQLEQIDKLQQSQEIFEYWSHAAAYLPMRDYRFSLPRKHAFYNGEQHWHTKDPKLNKLVLQRIASEGPLQAKDFERATSNNKNGWWDWKPAKKALEQLFMEGQLMVAKRQGFQKVYDLTERVLPDHIDKRMPSESKFHQHLVQRYLNANGIGTPAQISYLRKGIKAAVQQQCENLVEDGQLIKVKVKQQEYYAAPNINDVLSKPLSCQRVSILSPFDNLLIQRKRTQELFDFNYQIECYVPAAKRQYGYFSLPLLWGQRFAGRMDAKIDRKSGTLNIVNLHLETDKPDAFIAALKPSLDDFLKFNQGQKITVQQISEASPHCKSATQQAFKQQLEKRD